MLAVSYLVLQLGGNFGPEKNIYPPPLPTDIPPAPFPLPRLLLGKSPPPLPLFIIKTDPPATSSDASSLSPAPEQKKNKKYPKRPPRQACTSFLRGFQTKVAHFLFCLARIKMPLLVCFGRRGRQKHHQGEADDAQHPCLQHVHWNTAKARGLERVYGRNLWHAKLDVYSTEAFHSGDVRWAFVNQPFLDDVGSLVIFGNKHKIGSWQPLRNTGTPVGCPGSSRSMLYVIALG